MGTIPVTTEILPIQARLKAVTYSASVINLMGMPSDPTELVSLSLFIVKMTVLVPTGWGPKKASPSKFSCTRAACGTFSPWMIS